MPTPFRTNLKETSTLLALSHMIILFSCFNLRVIHISPVGFPMSIRDSSSSTGRGTPCLQSAAWWSVTSPCLLLSIPISFVICDKLPANVQDMSWHRVDQYVIPRIDACHLPFLQLGSSMSIGWFYPDLVSNQGKPGFSSPSTYSVIVLRCLFSYWNTDVCGMDPPAWLDRGVMYQKNHLRRGVLPILHYSFYCSLVPLYNSISTWNIRHSEVLVEVPLTQQCLEHLWK